MKHISTILPFYLDPTGKQVITLLEMGHISSTSECADDNGE